MAYNLPPFWSRGFALPDNVRAEDLQRGAFVTAQQPRGSYDDPKVGTAGYAVPAYVVGEGYGQGVTVTKWMPRGTAPRVAHFLQQPRAQVVAKTRASGGGSNYEVVGGPVHPPGTDPFHRYGLEVADHVLSTIKSVPAPRRKAAMRRLFDQVDPKLYTRVEATATRAAQAGIPAPRALHHAIATEFRSGVLRELGTLGATRKVRRASHVGLGCWGCVALGATDRYGNPIGAGSGGSTGGPAPAPVVPGGGVPSHGVTGCTVAYPPCTSLPWPTPPQPIIAIPIGTPNPVLKFRLSVPTDDITIHRPDDMPTAVRSWLVNSIFDNNPVIKESLWNKSGGGTGNTKEWERNPFYYFQIVQRTPTGNLDLRVPNYDFWTDNLSSPPKMSIIPAILHPISKKPYGVFLMTGPSDQTITPANAFWTFRWMEIPLSSPSHPNYVEPNGVWGDVVDWAKGAADAIGDAACKAFNTPGASQAAAGAAGASGHTEVAVGVAIAAGLCGGGAQPTPGGGGTPIIPPVVSHGPSMEEILLIGGAGLLAIYLLTQKKKG